MRQELQCICYISLNCILKMLFKYKKPTDVHVKFQRIIMGWLAISALFTNDVYLVWLFFILTSIGIITGTHNSPITIFYRAIKKLFNYDLVKISTYHIRYYQVNESVDFIDHLLRIIASATALLLFSMNLELAGWLLIAFLSTFMMLSAYFGFCLSALSYVFLQKLNLMQNTSCDVNEEANTNCSLSKHCFKPYKRCDSCHVDLTECLGTKFNTLILIVGLAMSIFLFTQNQYIIQLNIIFIMGLLFWLGYQVNYNTDELAESNNSNINLNKQLKAYNQTLEEEVQKRTSEIEHLVTHDQLTGIFNRYWFEKKAKVLIDNQKCSTKQYTMAFLDLDKFKAVNDTGGHLAGDELLRRVALLMKKNLTDKDILARLGGDEFAILFEDKNVDDTISTCNKICQEIDAFRFSWDKHTFQIGVSIGIADICTNVSSLTELLHQSDTACYAAKEAGRNRVVVFKKDE